MLLKILHTADLHLDSSFSSYLPKDKAKERKNELLIAFEKMVIFAENEGIKHILIAGDMFDKKVLTEKTVRYAERVILEHEDISFYYLKGNHDRDGFLNRIDTPANLFTFDSDKFTKYTIETPGEKTVCIYGTELMADTQAKMLTSLQPDEKDINIVMLHGQDIEAMSNDKEIRIDMPRLRGKAIDYLALGHVHAPKISRLDSRGVYSYCGCLEGRGFDECGERGFNVLTVDTKTGEVNAEFMAKSLRKTMEVTVDVSGISSSHEALSLARKTIEEELNQGLITARDLVKIVLTGGLDLDAEVDASLITRQLESAFYFLKTTDLTRRVIDYNSFKNDKSLKGEFVRQVEKDTSLSEDEKAEIIRTGILLLAGRKEEL